MGGIINARCECGFKTDFMSGSGSENFDKVCNAPSLCRNCQKFLVKNYLDKEAVCPVCRERVTFYDDSALQLNSEDADDAAGQSAGNTSLFILPDVKCLCPKCGMMQLEFTHVGCWS